MRREEHPVIFVGAGPGDPDLITVKGQRALNEADRIIYAGSLVPEALLKWADPEAEIFNSASMDLKEIVDSMVEGFNESKRVVRLHTGDPSLYGAIFEQMLELDERSIPYQVVPGVTAAFAAAASMKLEYTLPEITQTLIITRIAGRTPVPEAEALASLARHQASMAIYLSIKQIDSVAAVLKTAYGEDAPCAVAYRVSQPEEKIIATRIKDLAARVREENITHQAIIIVGKALETRKQGLKSKSKLYDKKFSHGFRKG
jgi:precorrin-4/cobalt-precorrin-4 C11-methyltransferase